MVFNGLGPDQDSARFRLQVGQPGTIDVWPALNNLRGRRYHLQKHFHIGWRETIDQSGYQVYWQQLPSAAALPLAALPELQSVQTGSEALNSNDHLYYLMGRDAEGKRQLYTVSCFGESAGDVQQTPLPDTLGISLLQYDNKNGRLLGLLNQTDSSNFSPVWLSYLTHTYLVEIDPATATLSLLSEVPVASGYFLGVAHGGASFDQEQGWWALHTISADAGAQMLLIDAADGSTLLQMPLPHPLFEWHIDNQQFAETFYTTPNSTAEAASMPSSSVFPNPSPGQLTVRLPYPARYQLVAPDGSVLRSGEWKQAGEQQLNLDLLPPACYYLYLRSAARNEILPVVLTR